jgi:hypothetical protein
MRRSLLREILVHREVLRPINLVCSNSWIEAQWLQAHIGSARTSQRRPVANLSTGRFLGCKLNIEGPLASGHIPRATSARFGRCTAAESDAMVRVPGSLQYSVGRGKSAATSLRRHLSQANIQTRPCRRSGRVPPLRIPCYPKKLSGGRPSQNSCRPG